MNKLKSTDNGRVWLRFMASDEMNNYIRTLTENKSYNDKLIKSFDEEKEMSQSHLYLSSFRFTHIL